MDWYAAITVACAVIRGVRIAAVAVRLYRRYRHNKRNN